MEVLIIIIHPYKRKLDANNLKDKCIKRRGFLQRKMRKESAELMINIGEVPYLPWSVSLESTDSRQRVQLEPTKRQTRRGPSERECRQEYSLHCNSTQLKVFAPAQLELTSTVELRQLT